MKKRRKKEKEKNVAGESGVVYLKKYSLPVKRVFSVEI